jgi:hypothetical protein
MARDEEEGLGSKYYEAYRENFKVTFVLAGERAKWLLSSLMLINSGAIAGIYQKGLERDHLLSVRFFGLGVLLALVAGIFGWFNLQISSRFYRDAADDLLKGDADTVANLLKGKDESLLPPRVKHLRHWAIGSAVTSVASLVLGASVHVRPLLLRPEAARFHGILNRERIKSLENLRLIHRLRHCLHGAFLAWSAPI